MCVSGCGQLPHKSVLALIEFEDVVQSTYSFIMSTQFLYFLCYVYIVLPIKRHMIFQKHLVKD